MYTMDFRLREVCLFARERDWSIVIKITTIALQYGIFNYFTRNQAIFINILSDSAVKPCSL
jgi:hypothetical protein